MTKIPVHPGDTAVFEKTISESDVYLFAGITGDLNPNHVNEALMKRTAFGARIVHGALTLSFASTASTEMINLGLSRDPDFAPVALGFDRVRFLAPVFIGDTISVLYTIEEVLEERQRSVADVKIVNEAKNSVVVASHLMKWLPFDRSKAS